MPLAARNTAVIIQLTLRNTARSTAIIPARCKCAVAFTVAVLRVYNVGNESLVVIATLWGVCALVYE